MIKKQQRKYKMSYRQRVFFCRTCNLFLQYLGNDPIIGKCECCGKDISALPLKLDQQIDITRKVTNLKTILTDRSVEDLDD